MFVGDMLVIASAASTEIGTDWLNPVFRPEDYFFELRTIKAAPVFDELSFDPFPVDGQRHEDDFSADPTDAGASERDVMNIQFDKWS
jgi:hypothetical protein